MSKIFLSKSLGFQYIIKPLCNTEREVKGSFLFLGNISKALSK